MRLAEEIVASSFAPTWRGLLARRLTERGLSQTEVAALLGISQSAVSKHLLGRLQGDERLAREPRLLETVERVAAGLHETTMSPFQALAEAQALVREFEARGPICRIHEQEMPELQGLGCDLCVRAAQAAVLPEQAALQDLRAALRVLEATPGLARLVPHVGTNVARAVPGARDLTQVAAFPGGLLALRGDIRAVAPPDFGVSRHVAEVLLAVMRRDAARLACLNLAPDARLLDAARAAGLRVQEVAADVEREPHRLAFEGPVPDLFWHGGAFGVEPQAYLTGGEAAALARRVRDLLADGSGPT